MEQVETDGKGLIEDFSDRAIARHVRGHGLDHNTVKARHVRGHGLDQHVVDLKRMNRR